MATVTVTVDQSTASVGVPIGSAGGVLSAPTVAYSNGTNRVTWSAASGLLPRATVDLYITLVGDYMKRVVVDYGDGTPTTLFTLGSPTPVPIFVHHIFNGAVSGATPYNLTFTVTMGDDSVEVRVVPIVVTISSDWDLDQFRITRYEKYPLNSAVLYDWQDFSFLSGHLSPLDPLIHQGWEYGYIVSIRKLDPTKTVVLKGPMSSTLVVAV